MSDNSQTVKNPFFENLTKEPDSGRNEAKVMDEVRYSLQWRDQPVERTCQTISQFHGPYAGSSPFLSNIIKKIAGSDFKLKQTAKTAENSVNVVNKAIQDVTKVINTINNITCSQMSTPMLRYFVTECQVLHPKVTQYIQDNIDRYPYFQQVSEQIGSHFTVISDCSEIDPLFTLECGQLPIENLKTAARMSRSLFSKMFNAQSGNMEDSQNFLNTLYLRALPCEENHGYTHPNYAKESPIAHGNNYCMDVHHQQRAEDAIPGVLDELFRIFGDRLRLLNQIFPVNYKVKREQKLYDREVEGNVLKVDRLNRVAGNRKTDNDSLKATEERFNTG